MANPTHRNKILSQLSRPDFALLAPYLDPIDLPVRTRLETPNKTISHVTFIDDGIVSIVATGPRRLAIEVGVIGWEGCTGHPVILGAGRSPLDTYVQVAGAGRRISAEHLLGAMSQSVSLRNLLFKSIQGFNLQVAFTALANGQATLDQRLARWLLMAHDRVQSGEISLTHDFLAIMLGVRRPGVTVSLTNLQDLGLIKKMKRGTLMVADRPGLEKLVSKFYGTPEAEMERLLGD